MSDLGEYLTAVYGDRAGYAHLGVGTGQRVNEKGKFDHDQWVPVQFRWPDEARQLEQAIRQESAAGADVYVCPYLMHGRKRAQGAAAARPLVHADVDGTVPLDKVRALGGFVVGSGTAGHGHVYVPLTESVPAHWHRALCIGLRDHLGNADAKISDNDVLRPPGTLNHKPPAFGTGDPAPVVWLVRPSGATWTPRDLAGALGVTLPAEAAAATTGAAMPTTAVDIGSLPQRLRDALALDTGDRSADTMRVVGACHNTGLTLAETRSVVNDRADLRGRLAERNDDDVLTCWLKATDNRNTRSRTRATNSTEAGTTTEAEPAAAPEPKQMATPTEQEPRTLDEAHATFARWLGVEYDTDVLDAVLCALAVERLDGDPLWLLVISGPGAAKTETVQASAGAGAIVESTITGEAALLSGTPKKERAKDATGGLLRRLGDGGVLVIKDVTSVISMSRDRRAEVLAALREVYDGYWSRSIGAEGGRTLTWSGRLVVIGAVTTAWDTAHAVISAMGDRFVNVRLDSTIGRQAAGRRTAANTGDEVTMRAELAAAVGGVIAGLDQSADLSLTEQEVDRLLAAADVVTLARTGVEYDYKGDVVDAHAPEMPTRFLRQLQQIVRGGIALGIDRRRALELAIRCARDTMPPVRLSIIDDLAGHPHSTTSEIRRRVDLPWRTVDRQCQALHMLGVAACDEVEYGDFGKSRWYYTLAEGIDPEALKTSPDLATPTPRTPSRETGGDVRDAPPGVPPANSGEVQEADEATPADLFTRADPDPVDPLCRCGAVRDDANSVYCGDCMRKLREAS